MRGETMSAMLAEKVTTPQTEAELAAYIADRHQAARHQVIVGGGTRILLPTQQDVEYLSTRSLKGIVTYEPGSLTLVVRSGTPVADVEALLASEGQRLAFEPMDHRAITGRTGDPTIGGMVAGNVSGPRRIHVGACRDHLLGVRFVDGTGRTVKSGGRVMKNVTGLDLGKLLCGSLGTLGIITEVALKTLPAPETEETLVFRGFSIAEGCKLFSVALGTPFEVSAAAQYRSTAYLRIEGFAKQVKYRRDRLIKLLETSHAEVLDRADSRRLWTSFRDLHHFAKSELPLWRIIAKASDTPIIATKLQDAVGDVSVDWGGGLIWCSGKGFSDTFRGVAIQGTATLVKGSAEVTGKIFPAQSDAVRRLTKELRRTFDPAGILNSRLMGS
jgi:glycolate oxidase FAD binding subunit